LHQKAGSIVSAFLFKKGAPKYQEETERVPQRGVDLEQEEEASEAEEAAWVGQSPVRDLWVIV